MSTRLTTSVILVSACLLTGVSEASSQSTRASSRARALPGRVVDVTAAEFFFRAPDTIPAGLTTFRLLQAGLIVDRLRAGLHGRALVSDKGDDTRGVHMLWVVRLDSGKTVADLYRAAGAGQRTTPWARQLGGPAFADPPATTNATLDLEPGNYALVCYIGSAREDRARSHLLNGMFRPLIVVPSTQRRAAAPKVDVVATISEAKVVTFSMPLRAGRMVLRVQNESAEDLEFKFQRVPPGLTGKNFLAQPREMGPGIPAGGLSSVPPRTSVITTLDFTAGEHIVGTHPSIRHATSQVVIVASTAVR
ncbi:MAG: hypothetical protein ABIV10_16225 [Gemmatimonadaceae bacterium]